ncbi:Uncharacterised protein [Mycobacteroides abscessus subsp. massiliense]|nr:Uncharacterised protein [Mycobacteroides abscessus subsp. massiliense]
MCAWLLDAMSVFTLLCDAISVLVLVLVWLCEPISVCVFTWLCEAMSVWVVLPEPMFVERSVLNESLMLVVLRCEWSSTTVTLLSIPAEPCPLTLV